MTDTLITHVLVVDGTGAPPLTDLVLFDPATIADTTTCQNTASRPRGIQKVFCNGTLAVDKGRYQGAVKAGRVLRAER